MASEDQQRRAELLAFTLGTRIRVLRQFRALSQAQLAEHAGIARSAVAGIERGASPSWTSLVGIADALGVHLADLVDHRITDVTALARLEDDPQPDQPGA